jgi:hypothetical protein
MDHKTIRNAFRFKAIGNFVLGLSVSGAVIGPAYSVPTLMDQWSDAAQIQTYADRFSATQGTAADYRRARARLEFENKGPLPAAIGHCYAASTQGETLYRQPFLACLGTEQNHLNTSAGLRAPITIISTYLFAVGGLAGFAMACGAGRVMRRELDGPQ